MVDMFDPILQANKPTIDLFGHGFVVLAVSILVEFMGVPKPSGSQSSILRRGHQLWLHEQVHAKRLASESSGPTEIIVIDDGNHVAHNRAYRYRPQSADWMARQLGVPQT